MEILRGSKEHVDACLSIGRELDEYFNEQGIATMTEDLRRHLLWVAVDSGEVKGFETIEHKNSQVAEISWLAVKLVHHRQGIGSALVDHAVTDLRPQGIKLLEVKTLAEDVDYPPYEKTRRFYQKMGFLHLETIDPYPGWDPGNPCAIYARIL